MLGPKRPEAVLPEMALYLPTFSHLLIVNKLLSLALSVSLPPYIYRLIVLIPWCSTIPHPSLVPALALALRIARSCVSSQLTGLNRRGPKGQLPRHPPLVPEQEPLADRDLDIRYVTVTVCSEGYLFQTMYSPRT
jgi:hypothetical protein